MIGIILSVQAAQALSCSKPLAPDLPQRPLLPRSHLLAGGVAQQDNFHSMPWRALDAY